MNPKPPKPKTCKFCGSKFTPHPKSFAQPTCIDYKCIKGHRDNLAAKKLARDWKVEKAEIKEKLKTWSDYIQELQKVFNQFIRLRDANLPCISCGTSKNIEYHAGHFIPAGNYGFLRFNEDNVHKQCGKNCNKEKHGNYHEYRPNLIKKIGVEKVLWLEENKHKNLDLTIPQIIELKSIYTKKVKELKSLSY